MGPDSLTDVDYGALNLVTNTLPHSGAFQVGRNVEWDRPPVRVDNHPTGRNALEYLIGDG